MECHFREEDGEFIFNCRGTMGEIFDASIAAVMIAKADVLFGRTLYPNSIAWNIIKKFGFPQSDSPQYAKYMGMIWVWVDFKFKSKEHAMRFRLTI